MGVHSVLDVGLQLMLETQDASVSGGADVRNTLFLRKEAVVKFVRIKIAQ